MVKNGGCPCHAGWSVGSSHCCAAGQSMRSGTNTFAKESYSQPSVISISTEFSVTKFVLYLCRKNRCLYYLPDCRGLTRATYILCIEHLRMLRLSRESNPRPPALQANTLCKEPFERHFSCHSESQLVLLHDNPFNIQTQYLPSDLPQRGQCSLFSVVFIPPPFPATTAMLYIYC